MIGSENMAQKRKKFYGEKAHLLMVLISLLKKLNEYQEIIEDESDFEESYIKKYNDLKDTIVATYKRLEQLGVCVNAYVDIENITNNAIDKLSEFAMSEEDVEESSSDKSLDIDALYDRSVEDDDEDYVEYENLEENEEFIDDNLYEPNAQNSVSEDDEVIKIEFATFCDRYSKYYKPVESLNMSNDELYAYIKEILDKEREIIVKEGLSEEEAINEAVRFLKHSVNADNVTSNAEVFVTIPDAKEGEPKYVIGDDGLFVRRPIDEIKEEQIKNYNGRLRNYATKKINSGLLRKPDLIVGESDDVDYSKRIRSKIEGIGGSVSISDETSEFIYNVLNDAANKSISEDECARSYLGYSPSVFEPHEAKLKLKEDDSENSGYPEDKYDVVSSFSYFGGKGKLMPRLCYMFDKLQSQEYDVFIDGFSGSSTVACNETTNAKYHICNDLNTMAMISSRFLSKGGEHFLEKTPEIVEAFFSMYKHFKKWPAVCTEVNLFEFVDILIKEYFNVRYVTTVKGDKDSLNKELSICLKKNVDDLHSALVDMVQSEWFMQTRNSDAIMYVENVLSWLETDEFYDSLSFDDAFLSAEAKLAIERNVKLSDICSEYSGGAPDSKEYKQYYEMCISYNDKCEKSKEVYELLLYLYYPFAKILFDISLSLHSDGKSNVERKELPLTFKDYSVLRVVAPALDIESPIIRNVNLDDVKGDEKKLEKRKNVTEIDNSMPEQMQKWYDLYDSTFGYEFKKLECFFSIPEEIVEELYKSEISIISMYIFRLAASHMNAGIAFNTVKFTKFLSGYFELKNIIDSARNKKDNIESQNKAVHKALVDYLGNSFKNRFRRLYNFAHRFANKDIHYTSFSYSVLVDEVIPKLLDKGLKVCLYLDPPYADTHANYVHANFGIKEHEEMIKKLDAISHPNLSIIISLNEESVLYYEAFEYNRYNADVTKTPWTIYDLGKISYASLHGASSVEYISTRLPVLIDEAPCKTPNDAEFLYQIPKSDVSLSDCEKFIDDNKVTKFGVKPKKKSKNMEKEIKEFSDNLQIDDTSDLNYYNYTRYYLEHHLKLSDEQIEEFYAKVDWQSNEFKSFYNEMTSAFDDELEKANKNNKRRSSYIIYPSISDKYEYELPSFISGKMYRVVNWKKIFEDAEKYLEKRYEDYGKKS